LTHASVRPKFPTEYAAAACGTAVGRSETRSIAPPNVLLPFRSFGPKPSVTSIAEKAAT